MFYISNSKTVRDHNRFDKMVVFISAPIQWVTTKSYDSVAHVWHRYIYLIRVKEQNQRLLAENQRLHNEVQKREEFRLENDRLKRLLQLRKRSPEVKAVVARVIATSPSPFYRSLRIDRGSYHDINVGDAVVQQNGVVGRIVAVSHFYADVMLMIDANSSIDVIVQRTRVRARIRGRGDDRLAHIELEYLKRTEDVQPGDVLITSGTGTVFPKGLEVGVITSVEQPSFGLYQQALAEASVDFRRLEEVMVLPKGWPMDASFENSTSLSSTSSLGNDG